MNATATLPGRSLGGLLALTLIESLFMYGRSRDDPRGQEIAPRNIDVMHFERCDRLQPLVPVLLTSKIFLQYQVWAIRSDCFEEESLPIGKSGSDAMMAVTKDWVKEHTDTRTHS